MISYIIHMQGDQRRRGNADLLLATLPDARIVDAVIGKEVMEETAIAAGVRHSPRYPFPLSPGEVGCFLSHRRCWQKIVEQGQDYALIAEDDLGLDSTLWPDVLDLIRSHANADTFIRIPAKHRENSALDVDRNGSSKLFLPRVIGLQTVCQVVGRNAARRLLAASETLDRPVDSFVQLHWATGQPVHTIIPGGTLELTDELGGSTIQKKTRARDKLAREIKRTWYRMQIKLRPQKPGPAKT